MEQPVAQDLDRLGPWLQNIHLPDGRQTAPDHPLGDWPMKLWDSFRCEVPDDLTGQRVLDIGCNAGFYAIELARRGADVVGLEPNPRYRRQARFAAKAWGVEDRLEVRDAQVYALGRGRERFDLVLFLGVFYHLRYPTLGLDAAARACRGRMFFQSLMSPGRAARPTGPLPASVDGDLGALDAPDWPHLAFLPEPLFGDPTNSWVPNEAAVPALLQSSGFRVDARRGPVYVCTRTQPLGPWHQAEFAAATGQPWRPPRFVYAAREGTLEDLAS